MTFPRIATLADIEKLERDHPLDSLGFSQTTFAIIDRAARSWPDQPALTFVGDPQAPDNFESLDYRGFRGQIVAAANAFVAAMGEPGGIVCYITCASIDAIVTIWGAQVAGTVAAINPYLEGDAIARMLASIKPSVLVVDVAVPGLDIWPKLAGSLNHCEWLKTIFTTNAAPSPQNECLVPIMDLRTALANQPDDRLTFQREQAPLEPAAYFHTGGTTGTPKWVCHQHRNQALSAEVTAAMLHWTEQDALLMSLPLHHVNGALLTGLSGFASGANIVIAGRTGFRDPRLLPGFWPLVERHEITFISAVPSIYAMLLDADPPGADQVRSLRYGISGAAPMSAQLMRRVEQQFGIRILEGYGLTEATMCVTINPPFGERRPGSIGLRAPYQDVRIAKLDEAGEIVRECAPREVGELVVKSYGVMPGYAQIDGAVANPLTRDGYLRTGDLGRIDVDGYIHLTGRSKDIILRSGHNIDPFDIESALLDHGAVAQVAAVGQIDPKVGEIPVAFVVLKVGKTTSEQALIAHAARTIAERAAVPKAIWIISEMPLTVVGKIDKVELRRRASESAVTAILAEALPGSPCEILQHPDEGLIAVVADDEVEPVRQLLARLPIAVVSRSSL